MKTKTPTHMRTATVFASIGLGVLLASGSVYAFGQVPSIKDFLAGKPAKTRTQLQLIPVDPPVGKLPVVPSSHRNDGALNVQVIVDTGSYTYDGMTAQSDSSMTDEQIMQTMQRADGLLYEKSGIHIRLRGIERQSLSEIGFGDLWVWARTYIETNPSPPEAFVIFSVREPSWINGGFAQLSLPASIESGYCNEFTVSQTLLPVNQRIPQNQRNAGIAIINWNHKFASCGYESAFPRQKRVSTTPTQGECANNSKERCVMQNGDYFQCVSMVNERSADPLYFRASSVVHELAHTLDVNEYGHMGEPTCNMVMSGDTNYRPSDLRYAEEYSFMCPRTFSMIPSTIRRCPQE